MMPRQSPAVKEWQGIALEVGDHIIPFLTTLIGIPEKAPESQSTENGILFKLSHPPPRPKTTTSLAGILGSRRPPSEEVWRSIFSIGALWFLGEAG